MLAALSLAAVRPAAAQASPQDAATLAAVRAEVAQLRDEVSALRALVADLRAATPAGTATPRTPAVEQLPVLQAQVSEFAQTKVESSSRQLVKLSGTILSNFYANSSDANWLENPNWVEETTPGAPAIRTMSATARQTRVGIETSGITLGNWRASGTLIADFMGGVPDFATGTVMGLPRLIYGFAKIRTDRTVIEVGQDHALLAPREPTSLAALSFPLLFRAGNLYLRAPQARVERQLPGGVTLAGGLIAPVAGDFDGAAFAPGPGAGERSHRPAFEGRVSVLRGSADIGPLGEFAVSGHYGWRQDGSSLQTSWAMAFDGNVRLGRVGAAGEVFVADNLQMFGGGIAQAGRAHGGWGELRLELAQQAHIAVGGGVDRPRANAALFRLDNRSLFGNVTFDLTPEVAASFEYRWLRTRYVPADGGDRANQHLNAALAIRF